ncbi:acyltransferase [soil metagenome]
MSALPPPLPTRRAANNFDGVRLIAAAMVLVSHQFALTGRAEPAFFGVQTLGGLGLLMFFSISGYLVSQSWLRSRSLRTFALNRLLRIWPAFAVVTLLEVFVLGPLVSSLDVAAYLGDPRTWKFLSNLLLKLRYELPGVFDGNPYPHAVNGSTWSIPVEVECYIVLAVLGLLGVLRHRVPTALIVALIVAHVFHARATGIALAPLAEFGAFFGVGALVNVSGAAQSARAWPVATIATALGVVLVMAGQPYAALVVAGPVLTIVLGQASTPVLNRAGRFGDCSYGLYLYAFPVQQVAMQFGAAELPFWTGVAMTATLTLGLAVGSWHGVERRALGLKPTHVRNAPVATY